MGADIDQAAAGLQHAGRLGEGALGVIEVAVGQQGDNRLERSVIERQRGGVRLDERDAEPARSRAMRSWSPDRSTPTTRQPSPVVLGHGLELRVNPFVLRRLWGRVGEEVQQLLGLLRAGLQANADQAHRAARLRATEH